jgi:hypothetical protein
MSQELATEASKEYLNSRIFQQGGQDDSVSVSSILAALGLCLDSNCFRFDNKIYKQISGVGTGVKMAPTYACLGMGKYEELVFSSNEVLLKKIILWKRFIDDVLMFFKGSKKECEDLVLWLNSLMPGVVKFKYDFSYEKIEFLDLKIFIEDGRIKTDLYVKPTNKQLYLDYNSNHPYHCKKGIPYSQALRVVERCAKPDDRDKHLAILKNKLEERNYPCELVEKQFDKAKRKERKTLIYQQRNHQNKEKKKVRLILTHNLEISRG